MHLNYVDPSLHRLPPPHSLACQRPPHIRPVRLPSHGFAGSGSQQMAVGLGSAGSGFAGSTSAGSGFAGSGSTGSGFASSEKPVLEPNLALSVTYPNGVRLG